MATLKVSRSDRFPVATTVKAYKTQTSKQESSKPVGAAVEEHAVDAEGVLTFTTLVAGVRYVLWAEVAGEHRYLTVEGPQTVTAPLSTEGQTTRVPVTLQERIAQRRVLRGAGVGIPAGADIAA